MPDTQLARFRTIAQALDSRFKLPGIPVRFGWDAILGLLPGVGDITTGVLASYGLFAGYRMGAPGVVLVRMLGNIALDTVIGAIPIVGDLFDIGWKGNLRNLALLERWMGDPNRVRQRSTAMIWAIGGGAVAVLAGVAYLCFLVLGQLLMAVRG